MKSNVGILAVALLLSSASAFAGPEDEDSAFLARTPPVQLAEILGMPVSPVPTPAAFGERFSAIRAEFASAPSTRRQEILRLTRRLERAVVARIFDVARPEGVSIHREVAILTDAVCDATVVHQIAFRDGQYSCWVAAWSPGAARPIEPGVGCWGTGPMFPGGPGMPMGGFGMTGMSGMGGMGGDVSEEQTARSARRNGRRSEETSPPSSSGASHESHGPSGAGTTEH